MPLNIVSINGESQLIDYGQLSKSFAEFLGPKVVEATLYVFNNFPATILPEASIDILVLISLRDIHGNYTRFQNKDGGYDYFRNAIIPITINVTAENSQVEITNDLLTIDGVEYDFEDEFAAIKYAFVTFLSAKIAMDKTKMRIRPVQFLKNNQTHFAFKSYLVGNAIDFELLFKIVRDNPVEYFLSYSPWTKDPGYYLFKDAARIINEVASAESIFGYLTRRKIERISGQLSRESAIYESIGRQATIISGKAGTGKTAHLIHLSLRCLINNRSITFLTYNHLLTKDIAYLVKMTKYHLYETWKSEGAPASNFAIATVQTLMGFIFKLSKSLGVLHLMTKERVLELTKILARSLEHLAVNLPILIDEHSHEVFGTLIDWKALKEQIQNANWGVEIKQYGIEFVRYLKKTNKSITTNLRASSDEFYAHKVGQLQEMSIKTVFLNDYVGCLKNTLSALRNTDAIYEKFNVGGSYETLEMVFGLNTRKGDEDLTKGIISLNLFRQRVNRARSARSSQNRLIFIDESQDCHSYEREIFYEIFGPPNLVASFGGKEQLIRFSEPCEWKIFRGRDINVKIVGSGNKSYRIKRNILDFCNFIAERHNIDLQLKSYSEEDLGSLLFDLRPIRKVEFGEVFSVPIEKGTVNGCTPLESLLILDVNHRTGEEEDYAHSTTNVTGFVNEYGVVLDQEDTVYGEFFYLDELKKHSEYWLGAVADKHSLPFPSPNEVRVINYESCRGLEAWTVICLNIDIFYHNQTKSPNAELFLLHEGIVLSSEQRAAMHAITWILMATTRAIDTLRLQMSQNGSSFVKLCLEYAQGNSAKCRIIQD